MTPAELRRAAREAEARGDHHTAARLRESCPPDPAVTVVASIDVRQLLDADLEMLAEACADEMIRRGREAEGAATR